MAVALCFLLLMRVPIEDHLAFAQTYTGFAGLFLTAALGVFAIQEFMRSQERPELHLALRHYGTMQCGEQRCRVIQLVLSNTGNDVAHWFAFQISLPFIPTKAVGGPSDDLSTGGTVYPVQGGDEFDRLRPEYWKKWIGSAGEFGLTFQSNGQIAVLPGFPLALRRFVVPEGWFAPG